MNKNQKEIDFILKRYNLQNNLVAGKVLEENFLSNLQIENIKKNIITALRGDKIASKTPIVIIVGGQSGSGKTALINYTQSIFSVREFIVIDNDLFRAFHPNVAYIRKYYPQFYTCATEQLGANITSDIISYFTGNNETNSKYNIILHQTLSRSAATITHLKHFNNLGYITGLNVLAVPYIESKMSQIERCQAQFNSLGFCRYVDSQHHFNSVSWLLQTVNKIEENKLANFINVFSRGEDISNPNCVYTSINLSSSAICENTFSSDFPNENFNEQTDCGQSLTLRDGKNFLQIVENKNGFSSAVEAIEQTRKIKEQKCLETIKDRIDTIIKDGGLQIPGMQPHIEEVQNFLTFSAQNCPPKPRG